MPKYLIQGSYNAEGIKSLLEHGVKPRLEAAEQMINALGGTVEAAYFALGADDVYVVVDCPDNVSITAASLLGNASGTYRAKGVVLLTLEEMDAAIQKGKSVTYRPPGQ